MKMLQPQNTHFEKWVLFFILLLAFVIRYLGVSFGLPHLYHADEPIVVNHALAYGTGDLNPHFFNIPPLVSYLLFVFYGIYYLAGHLIGWFPNTRDFEILFYFDPTSFYLIARVIFGTMLGTLSVFLLHRLARRLGNERMALLAAVFLAVNFLHARDSHYVYADIPLLTVLLTGMSVILRLPEAQNLTDKSFSPLGFRIKNTVLWHTLAGAMIGLAAAVKYNGLFLLIPYVWICIRILPAGQWLRGWFIAAFAAIATFILLNPFSILDLAFFLEELHEQSAANQGGLSLLHHFRYSLTGAFTSIALALATAGTIRGLFSKDTRKQAVSVFICGYYAVLYRWGQPYDRYVLPLIPFLCLMLADLIEAFRGFLTPGANKEAKFRGGKGWGGRVLFVGLILACVAPPLAKIIRWDWLISRPDTRTLAMEWIEANIPAGSKIAIDREFHTPRLRFSRDQLLEKLKKASGPQNRRIRAYLDDPVLPAYELHFTADNLFAARFLFAEPAILRDPGALKEAGIRYVVTTPAGRAPDPFMKTLEEEGHLLASFSPFSDGSGDSVYDDWILTGGPFLWRDIFARKRNGYPILIYNLPQDKGSPIQILSSSE